MRVVQPRGQRGSLKWIQSAIEYCPEILQPRSIPSIRWVSPVSDDDFAEYRDAAFLERIGLAHLASPLKDFWPNRGPQWDALGLADDGPILVEAKAHIREFFSPATQAGASSLARIRKAFSLVQADLSIEQSETWTRTYFQYANRLAFLWWLRSQGVDARLLFVSFLHDSDMGGPEHPETWEAAFEAADYALGLPVRHKLRPYILHVTPDVRDIASRCNSG